MLLEWVYRAVGAVAPINQRLSRFRLNFIPANLLLMFALGVTAAACWNTITTVLKARRAPDSQSLSALLAGVRPAGKYIAVEGRLMPEARIEIAKPGGSGNVPLMDAAWAPLADGGTGKAIMVQFPADRLAETPGGDVIVQGMLRPVSSALARELAKNNYVHAGLRIERRFTLVEGGQPGSLGGPLWYGGIAAMLLVALAWASVTRNVIFLPQEGGAPFSGAVVPDPSKHVLVSGTLTFEAATRRFFTHMPATIGRLETGDTALVSHIETSTTVYGMKTNQRSGLWVLAMRPGSVTEAQPGHVFWGLKKLRAVRFRYVSSSSGKSEQAVVASPSGDPMSLLQGV